MLSKSNPLSKGSGYYCGIMRGKLYAVDTNTASYRIRIEAQLTHNLLC